MNAPNTKKILLAEDDDSMRRLLEVILKKAGFEVISTEDGLQAMQFALKDSIDAVVADAIMPGLTGYDLCRMLRGEPALQKALYIAQTGWSTPEHRQLSKDAGFDHHLVKPVDFRKLETILQSA